jgi:peptidoglycan/xylan/chitin deacetylase (PgdA/CDA1 family)
VCTPSEFVLPPPSSAPVVREQCGALVISLDFELHWGVRDHRPLSARECSRLLAARAAIPRILDVFEEFRIRATWATVGLLFAKSRSEAQYFTPTPKPTYLESTLSAFHEQLGRDERDDPFHFAPSLISEIASRRGQEIGSHSFSHYYCMEPGQTGEQFEADLRSAAAIAANSGHVLRSYVFARNQVNSAYLPCLDRNGIWCYRSNEDAVFKRSGSFREQQRLPNRIARLLDAYMNICGHETTGWPDGDPPPIALRASRYLRPFHPVFAIPQPRQLNRIRQAMEHAARHCEIFHLWFHPEDFAPHVEANLRLLRQTLEIFQQLHREHGMASLSMSELLAKEETKL